MVEQILNQYEIQVTKTKFLRHNENKVYMVEADGRKYILRIHENISGIQADELIKVGNKEQFVEGEMELLHHLQCHGMPYLQNPIKNKQGKYITFSKEGSIATLLTFVDGQAINQADLFDEVGREEILDAVGRGLALLHREIKNVDAMMYLNYGKPCADRLQVELKKAMEKKHISEKNYHIMNDTLNLLVHELAEHAEDLQIVHGDLSKSNLLYNKNVKEIVPIDFSLNGYCVREYDLASMALHFERNNESARVLEAYCRAYGEEPNRMLIQICISYQVIMFIAARHEVVHEQGWFAEATDYWCSELMGKTLRGELFSEEIGLYQE